MSSHCKEWNILFFAMVSDNVRTSHRDARKITADMNPTHWFWMCTVGKGCQTVVFSVIPIHTDGRILKCK